MARLDNQLKQWFFLTSLSRASAVPETQVIHRTATGGTVTFTVDGETTAATAVVAATTAAQIKSALVSLDNIDEADITVTGATGGDFTVTGSIPTITVDATSATGGTVTVTAGATPDVGGEYVVPIGSLIDAHEITDAIRSATGFSFEGQDIDVPDLGSRYPKTIPGNFAKATPSITIYRNDDPASIDATVEAKFPMGASGFLVRAIDGIVEVGKHVQVWPVTVRSAIAAGDADATTGSPQTTVIALSVTDEPQLSVPIAA